VRRGQTAAVALALVLAFGGCGDGGEEAEPVTVTVLQPVEPDGSDRSVETLSDTVGDQGDPLEGLSNAPNVSTVNVEDRLRTAEPEPAPAKIRVPNVVGIDHQLAQDTMQAAGLYNLAEEDATGQGRMLLWDRNWTVVSQDPPAGDMVSPDTTIVLRSKKDDE
jgi:hypothetical protein